ncbi:hypothetical protein [Hamadaea tsunoensis]|uniref:hypothetical protein n=1 Tax=Hamadaea tsunoensis TaxID=53368 RepID=UPI00041143AC|nr:hypothetical protein [Hamadaea tsunoensis]
MRPRWFADPGEIAADQAAAAALRRLPAYPRMVAVSGAAGGAGATSVCVGLAATLAALWPGQVAVTGFDELPELPGVDRDEAPLWSDDVDPDLPARLRGTHAFTFFDVGTQTGAAARAVLTGADGHIVVAGAAGAGRQRALDRVAAVARPGALVTVVVRDGRDGDGQAGLPADPAFSRLDAELLERARTGTCRALLAIAARHA